MHVLLRYKQGDKDIPETNLVLKNWGKINTSTTPFSKLFCFAASGDHALIFAEKNDFSCAIVSVVHGYNTERNRG